KHVDPKDRYKYQNRSCVVNVSGGDPVSFTRGEKIDMSPRWSPDGKQLAFVSNRSGDNQVWLMPACGGEARQLTTFKRPLANIAWSPDGKQLVATTKIGPADELSEDEKKDRTQVKVITRLHYRLNGEGFFGDRRSHICLIDTTSGTVAQVTQGDYDHLSPTWSPDGDKIAFAGKLYDDADYVNYSDIYELDLASKNIRKLTESFGPCTTPTYSPDGQSIAFVSHDGSFKGATLNKLYSVSVSGGAAILLTRDFDRSVGNVVGGDMVSTVDPSPVFSTDGTLIYFLASDGGTTYIQQIPATGGQPEKLTGEDQVVYGYAVGESALAYAVTTPTNIGDIFVSGLHGDGEKRLTSVNKEYLAAAHVSLPERFTYSGSNGVTVEGWIMKPRTYEAGKRYPMILEIHGGPHVAYGNSFNHEFQVLTSMGYAVLFTNPQGSEGYGQAFNAATHHDWGGIDYNDLMLAVDHALTYDFVDAERLGVTGGSYGGYMTNWIVAHTNRFKVAVTQRSTCNRYSMFGTSDFGFNNGQFEFKGNPWDNRDFYMERSPISYVQNIETPLLLIHSEQDLRCPIEQGEQLYNALKWLRKETMFVRFPEENHELSRSGKPRHRVERLKHMTDWFNKYIPR
ncbi:MAG TPA: S9 family peptidase, partial [Bacillota bacterium]|nr:S9 family peptidase [Bacillota bacterium]